MSRSLRTFLKPGKDGNSSGQFTAVYVHMEHLAGASASADSWQSKEGKYYLISVFCVDSINQLLKTF